MLDFYISMWYYSQVVKRDGKKQVGIDYCEGPPVPIPNTEVKLACADDTWLVTARDNKFLPTLPFQELFLVGVDYCEGPPVPIPNTEVKLACAHDTWLVTARDNRFSPTQAVAKYCSRFFILLSP